jgi:hypothetical protein
LRLCEMTSEQRSRSRKGQRVTEQFPLRFDERVTAPVRCRCGLSSRRSAETELSAEAHCDRSRWAYHRRKELYESRGSRTFLGGPSGATPPGNSTI